MRARKYYKIYLNKTRNIDKWRSYGNILQTNDTKDKKWVYFFGVKYFIQKKIIHNKIQNKVSETWKKNWALTYFTKIDVPLILKNETYGLLHTSITVVKYRHFQEKVTNRYEGYTEFFFL